MDLNNRYKNFNQKYPLINTLTMQGQPDTHIILLYSLKFTNKEDTTKAIIDALQPYSDAKIVPNDITIQTKDGKQCSAHVKLTQAAVIKVCQVEKLKVADNFVNKRRYYPDFQIFINRINEKITNEEVKSYFEKFGHVEAVQITEGHGQLNDSKIVNRHCYIKFRNQQSVDKCLFFPRHQIPTQGQTEPSQVKVVRTYKIGQNDDTDKKIFIKITPQVINIEEFEDFLNNEFTKFGKLRQRLKVENIGGNVSSKAIVTFIKNESCQEAFQKIGNKKFDKFSLQLRPYISKQAFFRIFVKGLKPAVNQQQLEKVFEVFGKVNNTTLIASRGSQFPNAVVTFEEQKGFKKALIEYQERPQVRDLFAEFPSVTIHMNPKDRKQMAQFNKKRNTNQKKGPNPYIMNMAMGPIGMGPMMMGGFTNNFQQNYNFGGHNIHQNMNPNNIGFNPSQRGPNPNMGVNINQQQNTNFNIPRYPQGSNN